MTSSDANSANGIQGFSEEVQDFKTESLDDELGDD